METIRIFSNKKEQVAAAVTTNQASSVSSGGITSQSGAVESGSSQQDVSVKSGFIARLDMVSLYLFIALTFLLPLFLLPGLTVSFSKAVLTVGVTVVLVIVWIIRQLKSDKVAILYHALPLSLLGIMAVFAISSLLSGNYYLSFFGVGFEAGTGMAVIAGAALALLAPSILRTQSRVFAFLSSFFISFFVLAIYQLIRLFVGPDVLTFGFFFANTSNLLGKWNELSLFFGLSALLSVITLESLTLNRLFKGITWLALGISLFFLAVTNFNYTLIPVGIAALIGLLYIYATHRRFSIPTIIVLAIALVFIFGGTKIHTFVYDKVSTRFAVSQLEISPSFAHTISFVGTTLKKDPLFGVGPNMFARIWEKNKPMEVNQSDFWNNSFVHARGLIPTYAITTGILGILATLLFLAFFIYSGFKSIIVPSSNAFARYLLVSSFFGALYLWIFQLFYVPTSGLLMLTFLFTGAFVAALSQEGLIPEKKFAYRESPRASFVWVMVLIAALIGAGAVAVVAWNKVASSLALSRAYAALNTGDVAKGEEALKQALSYERTDSLYRTLVEVQISKMGAVLNAASDPAAVGPDGKKITQEQIAAQLSPLLTDALDFAGKAIEENPDAYENWMSLGSVYEGVMPLGYQGAYENAVSAYTKAMELSPLQPSIPLVMARLEASKSDRKDYTAAREWIKKALNLKQNYTQALFFDSQLSINEGKVANAIATVGQVAFLRPQDPTVFFQLGYLKYSDKDYKGAVEALQRAVELNADYANARYFLGLSLSKEGDNKAALAQFEEIARLNPENEEVAGILKNLRAGRSAMVNEPAPVVETKATPNKKKAAPSGKLPVKEE